MVVSEDLLKTANDLGASLRASPVVQAYLQAREALMANEELRLLEAKIQQVYEDLSAREQKGEIVFPGSVREFYALRETYISHPLVVEYARCQNAVKTLFEEVGSTISSILSVEYTQLAGE